MSNRVHYDIGSDRFFLDGKVESNYPITLCYNIGYTCNLSCHYCLAKNRKNRTEKLNFLDFVNYIEEWKPLRIVISGGEPLVYVDKLLTVLKLLKNNGINTFLSTNGVLVKETYSNLKGLIDWYDISLPAVTKQTYLKIRGTDQFDNVVNGINYLVNQNERVRLTFTINKENISEIESIPDFIIRHGVSNIRLSHTYSFVDGSILCNLWTNEFKRFFSEYDDRINIYYPLSDNQLNIYNKSYLILENDGTIYTGNVNEDNYLCHIQDIKNNKEKFLEIGKLQVKLFCGDKNE